jgi:hypothetical protein
MTGERAGGDRCERPPTNDQSVSPGHGYSTSSEALTDSETTPHPTPTTAVPNDEFEALDPGDRSCAEILLDIATAAELFHAADGTEFADIVVNGHRETWPIRSNGFKRWLARQFFALTRGAPNATAVSGGFGTRRLRTDQDEILFDGARPVILNGIDDIVSRPDLADRAVFLTLSPIPPHLRRAEQEFWAAFESVRPQILGVLLDALAHGLGRLPETRLDGFPRMADFALWATACETALWKPGTFITAYSWNVDEAVEEVIDADPVASAVRQFAASRSAWTGTASALLRCLEQITEPSDRRGRGWPTTARALSGRLRRAAPPLRKLGIEIAFGRQGQARTRTIEIVRGQGPSASSAPSAGSTATGGCHLRPSTDKFARAVRKESGRRGANGLKARLRTERTRRTQKTPVGSGLATDPKAGR